MYDSVFAPHVGPFALTFLLFWFCMCVQFALWGLVGLIQAHHVKFFFTGLLRYTQPVRCKDLRSREEGNKATMYK